MGGNSRTNSLHQLLDVETRHQVERDLVEQPPGRETYEKVYAYYHLSEKSIGIKSLERYGAYLRKLACDRKIGRLADSIVGRELGDDIAGQIRARLYEAITGGDGLSIGELMKASITEANVAKTLITVDEWEAKRDAARRVLEQTEHEDDPAKARDTLRAAIQDIYGIAPSEDA